MENVNIMDVASTELTQNQLDSITTFAEAKRQDEDYIVNVVGGNNAKIVYNKQKQIVRDHIKIGRNELCPCGSGKKYKNCCLKTGEYETKHTI